MTLYELTDAMVALEAEQNELDPEIFRDTFEGLDGAFEDKCDGWAKWIKGMDYDIEAIKKEEARLALRRKRLEQTQAKAKDTMMQYMRAVGKTKFKTATFSYHFGHSASVEIINEEDLPEWALKPQPAKIDKMGIRERLKNGEKVPGAKLVENESLQIK